MILDRVCAPEMAAHIFPNAVLQGAMPCEALGQLVRHTGASSVISCVPPAICALRMERNVLALTTGTWHERALPSRSSSEIAASLPAAARRIVASVAMLIGTRAPRPRPCGNVQAARSSDGRAAMRARTVS
jgi:hypothetical protein